MSDPFDLLSVDKSAGHIASLLTRLPHDFSHSILKESIECPVVFLTNSLCKRMVVALYTADLFTKKQPCCYGSGRSRLVIEVSQQKVGRSILVVAAGRRDQVPRDVDPCSVILEGVGKEIEQ